MKTLTPLLIIAIALGLFYLYVSPTYGQVESLMLQRDEYSSALTKASELQSTRDELLTKYNAFSKDDLARLDRILPAKLNNVQLVADIDSIAGHYGITVRSIQVTEENVDNNQTVANPSVAVKPYRTTTISLHFISSYPNLVQFLKDLEKSLQLIDIKSVSFQVPADNNAGDVYDYNVSFQTYWLN